MREPAPLPPHCENKARFPCTHGYDPQCITLLVNNYRSHPRLLQLPSALFYHDTLKPCANLDEVRCAPPRGVVAVFAPHHRG